MKNSTIAAIAAGLVVGAALVFDVIIPDANAVPMDKDVRDLVATVNITGVCAELLADGGFSITTSGTVDRRTTLPDGGFRTVTIALEAAPPCEIPTLSRPNIAQCARAARGMER